MASPTRQQPNKILSVRVTEKLDLDVWTYEDFPGDPYWTGGITPKSYRWEIVVSVETSVHGDPSTREPYQYNGIDINVGNWITDTIRGISLKIISVLESNISGAVLVVEDVDRYNTFLSETGDGIFPVPSNGIIFEISDMFQPVLHPLPANIREIAFSLDVLGRFTTNNPLYRTRVFQKSHNLSDNDSIWVDTVDGLFKTVENDDQLKRMVGTVDRTGPGEDIFYFIPTTKVIQGIDPPLPGSAGALIYVDPDTGNFTTSDTNTKIAYIQLTDATPDTTESKSTTVILGSELGVNKISVPFTDTTLESVVDNINAVTPQTNVSATLGNVNTVSTIPSELNYGTICGCIGTSVIIKINGTNVDFTDSTNGQLEFGSIVVNAVDMANTINSTNIPNITATGKGSQTLSIFNTAGGTILIENVTNDDSNVPFAGEQSCSGVPLSTPAGGVDTIFFTNDIGSGIIFTNILGSPVFDLGLSSVRNGMLPIGLVVEQFLSSSTPSTNIYPELTDLPTSAKIGEQAFVIDSNDGSGNKDNEWSMLLWDGFKWVKTSDEDSAGTDARSLANNIDIDSTEVVTIGTLSNDRRVVQVVVEVIEVFDDPLATLNVGDSDDLSRLMADDLIDLMEIGSYSTSTNFIYQTGNDVDIVANLIAGTSTQGEANVVVTYV